ncbi:hypothetical protein D030_2143B, partial [Vibrio parahaemolyticus AQ3810]
GAKPY